MQTTKTVKIAWLSAVLSIAGWATTQAQTNATWIGPNVGGLWNTAANWDTGVVPGLDANATTNAFIGAGTNVSYNTPMTAASFGVLTNSGILAVNASGFNCSSIFMTLPQGGDRLYLTNGSGAVTLTGNLNMGTNASAAMIAGTSLTVGTLNVDFGTSSHASGTATFTNSGGTLNANSTYINNGSGTANGLLVISGGVNNLGNTFIGRWGTTSASTLGTEGLAIYGGVVTMTNLNVGGGYSASYETAYMDGGIVTNYGSMFLNGETANRYARFVQSAGLFVMPDPGVVNPNSTVAGAVTAQYTINSGATNIVGGFYLGASNGTAAATVTVTIGGSVYVGSQGIATNGVVINTFTLNAGGLLGATAPWTGSIPMNMSGSGVFTIQTADMNGNPNSITNNGVLNGSSTCALNVTGGGTLTFGATNIYSGATLINGGTLSLGTSGALGSTPIIIVGPGTTFDVSGVNGGGGFVLNNNQTLAGLGSVNGAVIVPFGGNINPGSNTITGTLTFQGSLTETNSGAINNFTLVGAPNPNNDLMIINGDLNAAGTNYMNINGASLVAGTNYVLIQYSGNFNGGITNFAVETAIGVLTNDPVGKTISFIPAAAQRGPTNTVWIGNPVNTNWDNETSTNWLVASSGVLTSFVPGDSVQFTDLGASNSPVNIADITSPTSILFNSQSNYVIASTSGGLIAGTASLTTTNTGTLTILTTNTYSGNTTIDGGSTLAVAQVNNVGLPSAIGEGNLIINNGTFSYVGPSANVNLGATLGNTNSAVNVSANGNLTLSGNLTGNGGLTMGGAGTLFLDGSSSYAGTTTLSNGTLEVNGTVALSTNAINFDGGTLSFASQSSQNFFANVFNVATTGTMVFNGANGNNIIGTTGGDGGFAGSGTLNVDVVSNGYCTINAHMESSTVNIHVTDDSLGSFRLNSGGGNNTAQICTGSTNVTFDLGNGAPVLVNRNGGGSSGGTNYDVYDLGGLAGGSYTKVSGGSTGNSPSIYSIGANNLSTIYSGTIQNGTTGSSDTVGITKVGIGTLTLEGVSTYTGPTIVSNGVLALAYNPTINSDAEIEGTPTITIEPGAVIDATGQSTGPGFWQLGLTSSQLLKGYGTVNGVLDCGSSIIAPGDGINGNLGTLTVTGNIYLGGTVWMKINRAAVPNSDRLISTTGDIYYGGTLVVTNVGAPLQIGDKFTLFSANDSSSSGFTLVLPAAYVWDTTHLGGGGYITVTGMVNPPTFSTIDSSQFANGSITLYATNGVPDAPVNVLTSTNLASPLSQWALYESTYFDGSGVLLDANTSEPGVNITVNTNQPQTFYLLQTYGNP